MTVEIIRMNLLVNTRKKTSKHINPHLPKSTVSNNNEKII